MYEIKTLDDIRGNNVVIYSIKTLLSRKSFPHLSIMSGMMGVGKTSVAKIVAEQLDKSDVPVRSYNFGMEVDMQAIKDDVFSLAPAKPKAFIFEEIHGLPRNHQNALLQMFDTQSPNVYIICTTTEIQKVLRTIRSRAQVWDFKLLSEKQLSQLLDDYLSLKGATMAQPSRMSLLKACRGVPRDLINSVDFALAGDFNSAQLDSLLGNVSDQKLYMVFCTMKSNTADFAANVEVLMDDLSETKLQAMRDFWLRYLLERTGGSRSTLTLEMIKTLDRIYTEPELNKVAKMLLRATPDTLLLELVSMNMALSGTTSAVVLGQQRERAAEHERESVQERQTMQPNNVSPRVTADSIKGFKLGDC